MRWGNPDWYTMEQWEGIMAGVFKEHEDWQKEIKKESNRKYMAKWRQENPAASIQRDRAWRKANPERAKSINKKSRSKFAKTEKCRIAKKRYNQSSKGKLSLNRRKTKYKSTEKGREKILSYSRQYAKTNLMCRTCNYFQVPKRGLECSSCGGYRIHSAEYELRDYVTEWYPKAIFDKQIEGSCLKYRPDVFIETLWGVVIIEVDEHQHQDYNPNCEVVRERNLWEALGCDLTVIRFNPDSFKSDNVNTQRLTKEERFGSLFLAIQESIETHRPGLFVEYLFYSPNRIAELNAARNKLPK